MRDKGLARKREPPLADGAEASARDGRRPPKRVVPPPPRPYPPAPQRAGGAPRPTVSVAVGVTARGHLRGAVGEKGGGTGRKRQKQ